MKRSFGSSGYYDGPQPEKYARQSDFASPYGSIPSDYSADNGYFAKDDSYRQGDSFRMTSSFSQGGYGKEGRGGSQSARGGSGYRGEMGGMGRGPHGGGGGGGAGRGGRGGTGSSRGAGGFGGRSGSAAGPLAGPNVKFLDRLIAMKSFVHKESSNYNPSECVPLIDKAASKSGLKVAFEHEEITLTTKKVFTGCLALEKKYICRCHATNLKSLRLGVHAKLWEILLSMEPREIITIKCDNQEVAKEHFMTRLTAGESENDIMASLKDEVVVQVSRKTNTRKGFEKFQDYLLDMTCGSKNIPADVVQVFSQSLVMSKSGLVKTQKDETFHLPSKGVYFRSTLHVSEVAVATAKGRNKKHCKTDLFARAFSNFVNLPLDALVNGIKVEDDVFDLESIAKGYAPVEYLQQLPFQRKLEAFSLMVRQMPTVMSGSNTPSRELYEVLENIGLKMLFVFTKRDGFDNVSAEMYLEDIFIASGQGIGKVAAQHSSMLAAQEVMNSQTADYIDKFNKRFIEEESVPNCRRFIEKKETNSNLEKLLNKKPAIDYGPAGRCLENLTILERGTVGDRNRNAFFILLSSATYCQFYMKWIFQRSADAIYTCKIFLEGEEIGTGTGSVKVVAQRNAALVALYGLYETQPVVQEIINNDEILERAITFEMITELANSMKKSKVALPDDIQDVKTESNDDTEETFERDPYILLALRQKIDDFLETQSIGDIVFGPGFHAKYLKEINTYKPANCFCKTLTIELRHYMRINQRLDPYQIVKLLQSDEPNTNQIYKLVPQSELPKSSDLDKIKFQDEDI